MDMMVNTSVMKPELFSHEQHVASPRPTTTSITLTDDSGTSGSDGTLTDDDSEHISVHELSRCASHVQRLLKRITSLQQSFEPATASSSQSCPKHRVHKLYRRFCRRFESEMDTNKSGSDRSTMPLPEFLPPSHASTDATLREPGPETTAVISRSLPEPINSHSFPLRMEPSNRQKLSVDIPSPLLHLQTSHASNSKQFDSPPQLNKDYDYHVSRIPVTIARSDISSRGTSREGNQSATEDDEKQTPQANGEPQRTKTGRISKAKKGLKVHSCECGKVPTLVPIPTPLC
jgi:hypothetical protein